MADYMLLSRDTVEKTIELLECLHSPFPTELFDYLDTLHKLKSEMHEVDIQVSIVKHLLNCDSIPIRSVCQYPVKINQPG